MLSVHALFLATSPMMRSIESEALRRTGMFLTVFGKTFDGRQFHRGFLLVVLFVVACLLFSACASDDAPLLPMRAPLQANLVSPCLLLTPLESVSGAAVLNKLIEIGELYHECRRKHAALVEAVQTSP